MKLCNLNYLKSVSPKSNTFAIQIITLFLKDTPDAIHQMNLALESDNYFSVYKNTVKIKPSFQMIGLPEEYSKLIKEILELSNAMSEKNKIKTLINDLDKGLKNVYLELEKELKELKN